MSAILSFDKETEQLIRNRISFTSNRLNIEEKQIYNLFPHFFNESIKISVSQRVARYIDHTLLKPDATKKQLEQICNEAKENNFYAVCVNSNPAVVGFPLGAMDANCKIFETERAVENGANEIDMVINIGRLKDGEYLEVLSDIHGIVQAIDPKIKLKVILETCLLTKELIVDACLLSVIAGASFVKTSTGFSTGGAKDEHVKLMKLVVGNLAEVKASGGIRTYQDSIKMLLNGATRIGASSSVAIVNGELEAINKVGSLVQDSSKSKNQTKESKDSFEPPIPINNEKLALWGTLITAAISGFFIGMKKQKNSTTNTMTRSQRNKRK
ncbi:putative aldolase [Anaeramoeba ignava]|uniref:deoxyribose-phosphate aldolase n=1 Tax=Anaeramoeba ignava TaxID=1746090 RepID=A0A9Q0LUX7_ANAIG|nr:putative aldolase [Anaeramoeba ignava]